MVVACQCGVCACANLCPGKPTAGIHVFKNSTVVTNVGLLITRVNVSGFTLAGIATGRAEGASLIEGLTIKDSYAFNNPGKAGCVEHALTHCIPNPDRCCHLVP